jgi:hypothetical protein
VSSCVERSDSEVGDALGAEAVLGDLAHVANEPVNVFDGEVADLVR